jgi:uncharacterized protein YjbJ (UPF0337 family)
VNLHGGEAYRRWTLGRKPHMPNMDEMKGRAKEAVGDLTDDDDLKREGKIDRTAGTVKEKVGDAADKVKDAVRRD